jgi:hypothetical protein
MPALTSRYFVLHVDIPSVVARMRGCRRRWRSLKSGILPQVPTNAALFLVISVGVSPGIHQASQPLGKEPLRKSRACLSLGTPRATVIAGHLRLSLSAPIFPLNIADLLHHAKNLSSAVCHDIALDFASSIAACTFWKIPDILTTGQG